MVCTRPDRPAPGTSIPTSNTQDSSSSNKDARKFTVFPGLPIELRLKIWKLALPGRRFIKIEGNTLQPFDEVGYGWPSDNTSLPPIPGHSGIHYQASQDVPPPALLFVNAEARELALESYSPVFTRVGNKIGQHVVVYMDFKIDFLHLDYVHCAWADYMVGIEHDLQKVKNLVIAAKVDPRWLGMRFDLPREKEVDTFFKHFHR